MKQKEVIVVEGKHDSQKLKSFFDVDTIETNGLHLSKEKIECIKSLNEKRGVILFLDPDSAGERIRKRLNDAIPNLKNAFIDKKRCRTTKKVGIEHADKEALKEALEHVLTYDKEIKESLSYEAYLSMGFQGQEDSRMLRRIVGELLFLGECNSKTLFKRLNMFQITDVELKKIVEDIYE
ncbi:ribonuclease M5 [Breznakia sp. OttesenSCG-928-G09]|nr:ribonuclease M5 [Breznakia sp. OttesenSCG-928-G09]